MPRQHDPGSLLSRAIRRIAGWDRKRCSFATALPPRIPLRALEHSWYVLPPVDIANRATNHLYDASGNITAVGMEAGPTAHEGANAPYASVGRYPFERRRFEKLDSIASTCLPQAI